jgi:galactose mutarotase-like enzyme
VSTSPYDWIALRSDSWSLAVDPHGAQLSALRDAEGRDLLWDGNPAFWNGRAPILFPIVGALNGGQYGWRGKRYALPRHGFARNRPFEVIRNEERDLLFRLRSSADTLLIYPFHFELDVAFRLEGQAMEVEATVRNVGDGPMPASLGFHPAIRWPLPYGGGRSAHTIEFPFEETAQVRRLDALGLLAPLGEATPVRGRCLALDDALFEKDVLIFDQLLSRQLLFGVPGSRRVAVSFAGATHLGLWTKPGAGFLCIEPWRGVADPVGFSDDLDKKPGTFLVPPGGAQSLAMRLDSIDEEAS